MFPVILMDVLWIDLRYALRLMRRSPIFTSMAVLSLALGTGANTAIYSLFYTIMLRQLPVERPEQLVELLYKDPGQPRDDGYRRWDEYENIRDHNHVFAALTGMTFDTFASAFSTSELHLHAPVAHARGVGAQRYGRVVEAPPRREVEALLEDGRSDLGDVAAIADDSARDHERAAEWIEVVERVDLLVAANPHERDLSTTDQRGRARVGRDVVERADIDPGRRRRFVAGRNLEHGDRHGRHRQPPAARASANPPW